MGHIERPRFSCMLGGVLATASALPRTVPIIHGAQGCGNSLSRAVAQGGYLGTSYCGGLGIPSTNVGESDVIFGGGDRLTRQLETTFEVMDGDLFILTTACMTDIIGDDVKGVLMELGDTIQKPVIFLETGGFKGNSYYGYSRLMEELFRQFIPKQEKKQKNLVNLLGLVPGYDPFFRGDLEAIRQALETIGLEVNTFLSNDQTVDHLLNAGKAQLNIVLSRVYGPDAAEAIRETHGIDYLVTDLPVGAVATEAFLREVAGQLKLEPGRVEETIRKQDEHYYKYVERAAEVIVDSDFQNYVVVVANATQAIPYAKYLDQEIGWLVPYVFITDELSPEQKQILQETFDGVEFARRPRLVFETDTLRIQQELERQTPQFLSDPYYENISPVFVLGSTIDKKLADSLGGFLLPVSFPIINRIVINQNYAGYSGGLHLLEDLINAQVYRRI